MNNVYQLSSSFEESTEVAADNSEFLLSRVFRDLESLCELYADCRDDKSNNNKNNNNRSSSSSNLGFKRRSTTSATTSTGTNMIRLSSLLSSIAVPETGPVVADDNDSEFLLSRVFPDIESLCELYENGSDSNSEDEEYDFFDDGLFFNVNLLRRYFTSLTIDEGDYYSEELLCLPSHPKSNTLLDDDEEEGEEEPDEALEGSHECLICSTRKPGRIVLLDCGHAVSCRQCTSALTKCSVCRREIRSRRAVYSCRDSRRVENCDVCSAEIKKRVHFLPCRHAYTCEPCSRTLDTCPTCDGVIETKTVLYTDV